MFIRTPLRRFSQALFALALLLLPQLSHAIDVRVSGFTDIDFGTWNGVAANLDLYNPSLCVYKNDSNRSYYITATGSGAAGAFTLSSGGNTLAYQVAWKKSSGTGGTFTNHSTGVRRQYTTAANNTDELCGGTPNASMRIRIASATLTAARPGIYTGTVTILLEPT